MNSQCNDAPAPEPVPGSAPEESQWEKQLFTCLECTGGQGNITFFEWVEPGKPLPTTCQWCDNDSLVPAGNKSKTRGDQPQR